MGNRAEYKDLTSFQAIGNVDVGSEIVRPKAYHANQRPHGHGVNTEFSAAKPITLFSADNFQSYRKGNPHIERIAQIRQMTIDELDELAAETRCKIKFHREVPDIDYHALSRYIDYRKQLKKRGKQ